MQNEPQDSTIQAKRISLAERATFIKMTPVFSHLDSKIVEEIAEAMDEVQFEKSQDIVREGDLVDAVYIVAEGSVEISKKVYEKERAVETLLAVIQQGDNIGLKETGLYAEESVRTATATANSFCILLKIKIEDLQRILQKDPNVIALINENLILALKTRMIREMTPFAQISNSRLLVLAGMVKEIELKEGTLIFLQGDAAEKCYMIYRGKVSLYDQKMGEPIIIDAGLVGQAAFVSNDVYQTSAKASTDCTLLELDREVLREITGSTEEEVSDEALMFLLSKKSHPIRASNIQYIKRTLSDGSLIVTLKNPIDYSYIQLNDKEWFLWRQLNGELTLSEVAQIGSKHFPDLSVDDALIILKKLIDTGFAYLDTTKGGKSLLQSKESSFNWFKWVHFIKRSDHFASYIYSHGGKILVSTPALLVYFFLALTGCYYFFMSVEKMPRIIREVQLFPLWFLVAYSLSMANLITPLLKAMAIKKMKHDIPHVALIWNRIGFTVYVDASDLLMDSRKPRVIVSLVTILANLLAAGLLALLAYHSSEGKQLVFWLTSLILYFLTLRALNPMQNMVGYVLLANGLNRPNLHQIVLGNFNVAFSKLNFLPSLLFWIAYSVFVLFNLAVIYWFLNFASANWPELQNLEDPIILLIFLGFCIETSIGWYQVKNSQKMREHIV